MKIRVRSAIACLFLISFAICQAGACVTADTDLSSGGWETSAAADPCSSGHGTLLSSRQAAGTNVVSAHKYFSTWAGWTSYSGRDILATFVQLLAASRVEITSVHQDAPDIVLNSVTGANV